MATPFAPRVGGILSADIAVPDHEREMRFYSQVLGTGAEPLWREDLMNNVGRPVIGLGARGAEYDAFPTQWMPHILVADVAASVDRAVARGGRTLMHGRDANGNSQWAVLLDINGAAFGIIPVSAAEAAVAAAPAPEPREGAIAWFDLTVPDAAATRDFYSDVVGWAAEDVAMRDGSDAYADYNMLGADGAPAAGVCHARGVNAGLPPVWMLYLPVSDLEESLRRVPAEGGAVLKSARDREGACTFAVIEDPVGVHFALVPG